MDLSSFTPSAPTKETINVSIVLRVRRHPSRGQREDGKDIIDTFLTDFVLLPPQPTFLSDNAAPPPLLLHL